MGDLPPARGGKSVTGGVGDGLFFGRGEAVGEDVVAVGGVDEAGVGEGVAEVFENRGDVGREVWGAAQGEDADGDQLEVEGREVEGELVAPELEDADLILAAGVADEGDVPGDVGLDPGAGAADVEAVIVGLEVVAMGGDEVDGEAVESDVEGDVLAAGCVTGGAQGGVERLIEGAERLVDVGEKREEQVDIGAAADGGALGEGAAGLDGVESEAGPVAEEGRELGLDFANGSGGAGVDGFVGEELAQVGVVLEDTGEDFDGGSHD